MSVVMPSYRTCVLGGCAIGIAVATLFATRAGLTPLLWIAAAAFAVSVAFFLAAMTKVLFGVESFSFLHYQLATIAATLLMLPAALDLLALALAIAQAFGRIGCASAGCCHGRVGRVRVQYVESAALFAIAALTAIHGFAFYMLAYAVTRFTLEFFRRDHRRHWRGLSEAQWICVLTAAAYTLPIAIALWSAATAVAAFQSHRIRVTHGRTANTEHFTISSPTPLTPEAVAAVVRKRVAPDAHLTLYARPHGVWHVIVGGAA